MTVHTSFPSDGINPRYVINDELPKFDMVDDLPPSLTIPEFTNVPDPDDEPLITEDKEAPDADPKFVNKPRKKRGALEYEKKITELTNVAARTLAARPETVPDAAALFVYGPNFAEKWGELAAHDDRVARAIDMLTEGTSNPYLSVVMATAPLVVQLLRNHEPVLEPQTRGIPWGRKDKATGQRRKLRLKFGIKIGGLRAITVEPKSLAESVFTNPEMMNALARQGVSVAGYNDK